MIRCVQESIRTVWWVQKIVLLWWVCKIKVKDDTHRLGRHAAFKCTSCKGHPSGHKSQNKLHSRRCWKEVKSPIEWWFRALWHQHNLNYLIKERVKVSRSSQRPSFPLSLLVSRPAVWTHGADVGINDIKNQQKPPQSLVRPRPPYLH